jgi:hypothetical protein
VAGWDTARTVEIVGTFAAESAHVLLTRPHRLVQETQADAEARALRAYPDDHQPSPEEQRALWA